jgi:hypothetical protein
VVWCVCVWVVCGCGWGWGRVAVGVVGEGGGWARAARQAGTRRWASCQLLPVERVGWAAPSFLRPLLPMLPFQPPESSQAQSRRS